MRLCKNTNCSENRTEDYTEKCRICDGYFIDDGLNDILFIEEKPNNKKHSCDLCKKEKNIVQMKSNGQYICSNACDESEEEQSEDD